MLDADLRRAEDVSSRVKRDANAVDRGRLSPINRGDTCVGSEARAQNALALARREVLSHAPARMVTVCMGDDRARDRLPGVDVEVAGLAVQAAIDEGEQRHVEI